LTVEPDVNRVLWPIRVQCPYPDCKRVYQHRVRDLAPSLERKGGCGHKYRVLIPGVVVAGFADWQRSA
jgi:hypothetical protein